MNLDDVRRDRFDRGQFKARFGLIVLKNSVSASARAIPQKIFPRKRSFGNDVRRCALSANDVLVFERDFAVAEFFNTIGSVTPLGGYCPLRNRFVVSIYLKICGGPGLRAPPDTRAPSGRTQATLSPNASE